MSFARPTLSDIIKRIQGDIKGRLTTAEAALRHAVLSVLARTLGGVFSGVYGYLDWLAKQLMPDSAEKEYLSRHASFWSVSRKAATAATARATASGTNGATIPVDTEAQRMDGSRYKVLAAAEIVSGTATLSIEAIDTGAAPSLNGGDQLTFTSAVLNVDATITVIDESTIAGTDEEQDDSLLSRLFDRVRTPPSGGKKSDYVAWAKDQPGVTRAWCFPGWMGAGTVGLAFVLDGREDILPTEADVEALQAAIDEERPVTAELYVFSPPPWPVDLVISLSPDTPEGRAAVLEDLADFFIREAEPSGTIWFSRLREAISLADSEQHHELQSPVVNFLTASPGEIPTLGNVTFV